MRRVALMVLLLAAAPMAAQFQPDASIDSSAYTVREDLATAGDLDGAQRVVRFVQVSDAHILDDDAPAPMRVEVLDQFGPPFDGAMRPHEEYTDEILNAGIAAINAIHADDALDFVINTGDNIDNQLENELMRFIDNWEGTTTTVGPVSGLVCVEDGQSADETDDSTDSVDACTHLPETVAADNTALLDGLPWYSAFGNHDGLVQGNAPVEPSFNDLADQFGRQFLEQEDYVDMHFLFGKCVGGVPGGDLDDDMGHGYGFAGDRLCDGDPDNDGYYAFSVRGVRFIVLDTVNDDFVTGNENLQGQFNPQQTLGYDIVGGYAEGAIDADQYAWMQQQITTHAGAPVIVFAHHTVNSMFSSQLEGNCNGDMCLDDLLHEAGYVTGPALTEELASHDNVLAFIGGHTHRHRIEAKTSGDGGFWNIETSALIDHPQETRAIELWSAPDGKWLLRLDSISHGYAFGADLAASDPHLAATAEGEAKDQDVLLWLDAPSIAAEAQPELPRVLRLATDGAHAHAGQPHRLQVQATDVVRDQAVDGLNLSVDLGFTDGTGFERVLPLGTAMESEGNGTYVLEWTPEAASTHFATVVATDPDGRYDATTQVFSIVVEGDAEPDSKDTPAPWLAAIVVVVVLVRQKR